MAFPRSLNQLCAPSLVYFIFSVIVMAVAIFQNMGNSKTYCLGSFSCNVPSTALVFAVKSIYVLFWTWVLNLICKDGHSGIAWLLVLFPFVLLFVIIALIMMNQGGNGNRKRKNH